jgi:hypothetical protein
MAHWVLSGIPIWIWTLYIRIGNMVGHDGALMRSIWCYYYAEASYPRVRESMSCTYSSFY